MGCGCGKNNRNVVRGRMNRGKTISQNGPVLPHQRSSGLPQKPKATPRRRPLRPLPFKKRR